MQTPSEVNLLSKALIPSLNWFSVSHTRRDANSVAHSLARDTFQMMLFGLRTLLLMLWSFWTLI